MRAAAARSSRASAGALFGKAHHLSEEVHQAMVARGYRGDARTLDAGCGASTRRRLAVLASAVLCIAAS